MSGQVEIDIEKARKRFSYEAMLREFHTKFLHHIATRPSVPPDDICDLRYKLIDEEVNKELLPALQQLSDHVNFRTTSVNYSDELFMHLVNLADALADSVYVIVGTALSYGIPMDLVFAEVHRSNMTKSMEKDTKSIKGKTLKGPDWKPPQIDRILEQFKY